VGNDRISSKQYRLSASAAIGEEKIQVTMSKVHSRKFTKSTFTACNQIMQATAYFADRYRHEVIKENYLQIYRLLNMKTFISDYIRDRPDFEYKKEDQKLQDITNHFSGNHFANIKNFEIAIGIPLIVLHENNRLIRVKMKNDKVQGFVDIGYGLYLCSKYC
jgi:hypothetical protein